MPLSYNIAMKAYALGMRMIAPIHPKAKKRVEGMEDYWEKLEEAISPTSEVLWVHAASLGELEQGWPIVLRMRETYPKHDILLTFSSPSGYEHFKNDGTVDHVFYLPVDTWENANRFVATVAPELAFFIKYEIWLNYYKNLQQANVPIILAPAVFRPDQFYFKNYGKKHFLPVLKKLDRIMVQDKRSKELLDSHGFENVDVVGDSRFDRAIGIADQDYTNEVIAEFAEGHFTLVAGSTWEADEEILERALDANPDVRLVIAPHEVSKSSVERIRNRFGKQNCALHSVPPAHFRKTQVLIIDSMGILSKIYRFGQAAYIGGGFKSGVHSTVEAVVYGIPILFGPKHQSFVEPREMIEAGFAFEVDKKRGMEDVLRQLAHNPKYLGELSEKARKFGRSRGGGTDKIVSHIERLVFKAPVRV